VGVIVSVGIRVSVAIGEGVSVGESTGIIPWHPVKNWIKINPDKMKNSENLVFTLQLSRKE
jgi:hypothetical protein